MDTQAGGALARWREQLDGWAIPAEILAAAPESPWGFPVGLFRSRARRAGEGPPTPSTTEAARHLPDGGSVLDVGAGPPSAVRLVVSVRACRSAMSSVCAHRPCRATRVQSDPA